jgi:hypothetical protein
MDNLNTELKRQAIACGLCEQWQSDWSGNWDFDTMADKLFEGINFCAKNRYPDKDFIVRTFDKDKLRSKNIIADDNYSLLNPTKAFIIGKSTSNVRYNAENSGLMHIQGQSHVKLTAKGRSHVIAHIWDKAKIDVEVTDMARVFVVRHTSTTEVKKTGNVSVRKVF